ncbi:MAG: hypothetical protein HC822_10195 [Oscillochloris sp.]|nr:hypothetical protein [Oscillochloris sp.]
MEATIQKHAPAAERWETRITAILSSAWLAWVIILGGMALRLIPYRFNRSLWFDEAALALNIIQRDYARLLEPLDLRQTGPIGFLFAERFAFELFGSSEYALRLVPLLASLAPCRCCMRWGGPISVRRPCRWRSACSPSLNRWCATPRR